MSETVWAIIVELLLIGKYDLEQKKTSGNKNTNLVPIEIHVSTGEGNSGLLVLGFLHRGVLHLLSNDVVISVDGSENCRLRCSRRNLSANLICRDRGVGNQATNVVFVSRSQHTRSSCTEFVAAASVLEKLANTVHRSLQLFGNLTKTVTSIT